MGTLIRLAETFNNGSLPQVTDYDSTGLLAALKAHASVQAMYDFTDSSTMVIADDLVSSVTDISGNGHTLTAAGSDRPEFVADGLGANGGLLFNDNKMTCADLWSGADRVSVSALLYATGHDATSRIYLSDASDTFNSFYISGTANLTAYSADIFRTESALATTLYHMLTCVDHVADTISIRTQNGVTTGSTTRAKQSGGGNVGAWADAQAGNKYRGLLGHLFIFNEDLSDNDPVRTWVMEYTRRKYGLAA